MRKLLPIVMALIGLLAGVGAGKFFAEPPPPPEAEMAEVDPGANMSSLTINSSYRR
jgi:hypothetical protein